jgi:PAS domain S-box-containing protein
MKRNERPTVQGSLKASVDPNFRPGDSNFWISYAIVGHGPKQRAPVKGKNTNIPNVAFGRFIFLCLQAGRFKVLEVTAGLVALIAFADWAVGNGFSLGGLYILPVMLAAIVLTPLEAAVLAVFCAFLRSQFDTPGSHIETILRFVFASLAYFCSGLFVTMLVRNRELVLDHLENIQREQSLRSEAQQQLRALVESSPAAILTLDGNGIILAANNAAKELFTIADADALPGRDISKYLPVLSDALRFQIGPEAFRTAAQCQGRRENGEMFLAHTWFSSYVSGKDERLAAIVVDSSEEMRDREEQNLRELMKYNRIAASAVSHEVRNVCAAISLVSSNLRDKHRLDLDEDYQTLLNLVSGLEKIASLNLPSRGNSTLRDVPLQPVLDSLRIIIESEWREIGGKILWPAVDSMPNVVADPHGLLQAFLNLVQNSYRAVQESARRELAITVSSAAEVAFVRLRDSGPGISSPEQLFQPFQGGADGAGLGLYISRALVRSYGGDLRFEPREDGTCFLVELQIGA